MAGLLPNYILREFGNDGKLLSGGLIYFYESGTFVPKAVYSDATEATELTNPVVLDASGSADIWLGAGAYRVSVCDRNNVPVRAYIDGVTAGGSSGGSSPGSTLGTAYVMLYNDLRALTDIPDMVYVAGNSAEGDGGQGTFQLIPGSSLIDDSGIILTSGAGSNVYKRVFDAAINPQWYGVRYGINSDQTYAWNKATAASALYGFPLEVSGTVYLNQNTTVPAWASVNALAKGAFNSTLGVTMTFTADSRFDAIGVTFLDTVQPIFGARVTEYTPVSWFGGSTEDTHVTKWLASGTLSTLLLDKQVNIALNSISTVSKFQQANTGFINFSTSTPSLTISLPNILDTYTTSQIFTIPGVVAITSISFGSKYAYPEWFGAKGDGSTNDTAAFALATQSGNVWLSNSRTYSLTTAVTGMPLTTTLSGTGTLALASTVILTTTNLVINDIKVVKTGNWCTVTNLTATNAKFDNTFTATSVNISGCTYTNDTRNPTSAGAPALYNGYFPLIQNAGSLRTDSYGKVIPGNPLSNSGGIWDLKFYGQVGSNYPSVDNNYYKVKSYSDGWTFVIGNRGELYKTQDNGDTWTNISFFTGGTTQSANVQWNMRDMVQVGTRMYYAGGDAYTTATYRSTYGTTTGASSIIDTNGGGGASRSDVHSLGYDPVSDTLWTVNFTGRIETIANASTATFTWATGTYQMPAGAGLCNRTLNGQFVMSGASGAYYVATTGTPTNTSAWATYNVGTSVTIVDMIWDGTYYWMVGTGGYVARSLLLGGSAVWIVANIQSSTDTVTGIAYVPGDGYYITTSGSGSGIEYSSNGNIFGERPLGITVPYNSIAYNSTTLSLTACGNSRVILNSK
jgi:hypothetical protein